MGAPSPVFGVEGPVPALNTPELGVGAAGEGEAQPPLKTQIGSGLVTIGDGWGVAAGGVVAATVTSAAGTARAAMPSFCQRMCASPPARHGHPE